MQMTVPVSLIGAFLLLCCGSVLTLLSAWFWHWRDAAAKAVVKRDASHEALDLRMHELERQLAVLSGSVMPISAAFQAVLVKELTHLHTPVTDALLAKIGPPSQLTPAEELALAQALLDRSHDMHESISALERDAAIMLPMVIKRTRAEFAALEFQSMVVLVPKHEMTDPI